MPKLRRCINLSGAYIRCNICSFYFAGAVILFAFILYISVADDFAAGFGEGIHYYLHFALLGKYKPFLTCVCAVPSILNFSREWRNEAFLYYYSRTGKISYSYAVCISSAFTSFITAVSGCVVFIVFLSFREPFYPGNELLLSSCIEGYNYGILMQSGDYILYYLFTVLLQGVMTAFFSAAAVCISTVIIDPYLSVISPIIISPFITKVMDIVGIAKVLNPEHVYNDARMLSNLFNPDKTSSLSFYEIAYPYIYTVVAIALFGILIHVSLNKKTERVARR